MLHASNVSKLKWSLKLLGLRPTIIASIAKITKRLGYDPTQSEEYWNYVYRCFDERFAVETSEVIKVADLDVAAGQSPGMNDYEATSPVAFGTTFDMLNLDFQQYEFVDYGSGKGRAMFMAAFFPFSRIVGVELSEDLNYRANRNVMGFLKKSGQPARFEIVQEDAMIYQLSEKKAVLYFFNPFDGDVMTKVMETVEASWRLHPRHLVVVYHNPKHRDVLDRQTFLKLKMEVDNVFPWLVYETASQ